MCRRPDRSSGREGGGINNEALLERARLGVDALKKEKFRITLRLQEANRDLDSTTEESARRAVRVRRSTLTMQMTSCDEALARGREEIRRLNDLCRGEREPSKEPKTQERSEALEELIAMRNFYEEYAADPSRVSSRRQMAAEFTLKLRPIIKGWINERSK